MQRPEELSIWLEYFDGKETYRIRSTLSTEILFQGLDSRRMVGYAAENMYHKLEKDLFDRA